MSTFFRKRPPYTPRSEHEQSHEDDFPVIGPAAEDTFEEDNDYPVLEVDSDENDVPIVSPAEPIDSIPLELESAIESIVKEEMVQAEQRIRQRVSAELKKHFED